jgi:hypothetical protein
MTQTTKRTMSAPTQSPVHWKFDPHVGNRITPPSDDKPDTVPTLRRSTHSFCSLCSDNVEDYGWVFCCKCGVELDGHTTDLNGTGLCDIEKHCSAKINM